MGNCSPCNDVESPNAKNPKFQTVPNPNNQQRNAPPKKEQVHFIHHLEEISKENIDKKANEQPLANTSENNQKSPLESGGNNIAKPNLSINNSNLPSSNFPRQNLLPDGKQEEMIINTHYIKKDQLGDFVDFHTQTNSSRIEKLDLMRQNTENVNINTISEMKQVLVEQEMANLDIISPIPAKSINKQNQDKDKEIAEESPQVVKNSFPKIIAFSSYSSPKKTENENENGNPTEPKEELEIKNNYEIANQTKGVPHFYPGDIVIDKINESSLTNITNARINKHEILPAFEFFKDSGMKGINSNRRFKIQLANKLNLINSVSKYNLNYGKVRSPSSYIEFIDPNMPIYDSVQLNHRGPEIITPTYFVQKMSPRYSEESEWISPNYIKNVRRKRRSPSKNYSLLNQLTGKITKFDGNDIICVNSS